MRVMNSPVFGGDVLFFSRDYYSTAVLATGQTSYNFFANNEAASLRNYNRTQNFFTNNRGRILGLQAQLYGAAFAAVAKADGTIAAFADAFNSLVAQAEVKISIESQPVDYVLLKDLMPTMPMVLNLTTSGTPTGIQDLSGGIWRSNARKPGKYYEPPIDVGTSVPVDIQMSLPSGVSVSSVLNGMYLVLYLAADDVVMPVAQMARH